MRTLLRFLHRLIADLRRMGEIENNESDPRDSDPAWDAYVETQQHHP